VRDIDALLSEAVKRKASDLHLNPGRPPVLRIDGDLVSLTEYPLLDDATTARLCRELTDERHWKEVEQRGTTDFGLAHATGNRFRVSVLRQRGRYAAVLRQIPSRLLSFDEIGLPPSCVELLRRPRGLVLVTGPTGSGKSTTLAAMLDKVNSERHEHIVTIEDPVEYLHSHKKCLVNQREVHSDTHSYSNALRSALREDPDVVLIGEMRDLETIESALRIAETGHLTFATLHTNSAVQTINRIIDVFPAHQQSQIRAQLSFVLEGILCQALLPRANNQGRTLSMEILVPNSAIRNLVREDKIHQIYSMMQTGQAQFGMQTFNQSLATLYFKKQITLATALSRSSNPDELQDMINRGAGLLGGGQGEADKRPVRR